MTRDPDGFADPPPRTVPRRCESCGALEALTVFVPNDQQGGRRLCARCLNVFDRLKRREPAVG